jgi:hypothetical protein
MTRYKTATILTLAIAMLVALSNSVSGADLPDPDGKPANMTKKVQVFIIMGQSNTLEMGKVAGGEGSLEHAVKTEKLYPFMIDGEGNWTKRMDVRNLHVMGSGGPDANVRKLRDDWLTVSGKKIGIETGIGHQLGNAIDAPVLILKSAIGNRSLGWDLLPPGTKRYSHNGVEAAGYKETVKSKKDKTIVPFVKGGDVLQWYAGLQYDGDVARAKQALAKIGEFYPGATEYEVAGFIWFQGDKDRYNEVHAANYGKNLQLLFNALRKDFESPNAKFVCGTLGQTKKETAKGNEKLIMDGMFAFGADAQNKGKAAVVYTHPLSMGSSSNGHYGGNAKTYMNFGLGLGKAMADLLKK